MLKSPLLYVLLVLVLFSMGCAGDSGRPVVPVVTEEITIYDASWIQSKFICTLPDKSVKLYELYPILTFDKGDSIVETVCTTDMRFQVNTYMFDSDYLNPEWKPLSDIIPDTGNADGDIISCTIELIPPNHGVYVVVDSLKRELYSRVIMYIDIPLTAELRCEFFEDFDNEWLCKYLYEDSSIAVDTRLNRDIQSAFINEVSKQL